MADLDEYDGFFDMDQLLFEEGLLASTLVRNDTWEHELVRKDLAELSDEKRNQVVLKLLGQKIGNKLPWGAQSKLAKEVGVDRSTISRIFKKASEQQQSGEEVEVSRKRKDICGKKPMYENTEEWLQSAPLHLRGTTRSYASALNCSHTHIHKLIKKGVLRAHTSANKHAVSEANKINRIKWVLQHIEPATRDKKATFVDMKHTIHIDEKWFLLNPGTRRFYMLAKEVEPYRSTKHRNYSIKVMFMGVTSRPLYDDEGNMIHDGKFGIFPFVFKERAKRTSKNRVAVTIASHLHYPCFWRRRLLPLMVEC